MKIFKKGIFPRSSWSDILPRRNSIHGLVLILDQDLLRVDAEQVMLQAVSAGVTSFQYRSKHGTRRMIYDISLRLAQAARKAGVQFIVNDHADIAVAVDADGVHLGQEDLPIEGAKKLMAAGKIIGISTHSVELARAAEAAGADYIGFGPLFPTATKDAGPLQGIGNLSIIRKSVAIPIVGIGGINGENVQDVIKAGADGAAVISAVLSAPDPKMAAEEMVRLIRDAEAGIGK
jgi:thiamine-phosphate pyrophosphorylase